MRWSPLRCILLALALVGVAVVSTPEPSRCKCRFGVHLSGGR